MSGNNTLQTLMKYRIRIDLKEDQQQYLVDWCKLSSIQHVIVYHVLPHGNPHYHIYMDAPMCFTEDAMRQRIKRVFKIEKRGDYSVKKCDDGREDEYISYMFNTKHGNVASLIADNVGGERIAKCLSAAQEISDDFNVRKAERQRKSKGITVYELAEEVATNIHEDATIEDYTKLAISVCHAHRKCCEPNMLIKIVATSRSFKEKDFLVRKLQFYFQET